ncbi:MAG: type 2 isopentenyl-diphosphate Delta-isomerase [Nitrososphaerota archaeon]|nr:type 2 isopentenyl-diphosphate Delta-isomerase [Nitrososphaerota archaeon]MDG7037472.1 type 2 isopentenyl-diphosphate Delta-isomerase [Nitrososphaerota archaeon]MDG7038264.1 type 2 isopentenyl-diphosphate Delta-isomerase [Nitrososphaerota archaeon]MDG7040615.1 type 2 isopentenyl-diphosphate Delta-isomerase [Nitrososphaerota archaeon]
MTIEERKDDHLAIALEEKVEGYSTTWLEHVFLINQAAPELNYDEVNTEVEFLGHKFSAPLMIDCMTGGGAESFNFNRNLAEVAAALRIGMGVGSQRVALVNPDQEKAFSVVRDVAPDSFIMANIGGAQIGRKLDIEGIRKIINMVKADALAIHFNPLQELVQVGGEASFAGVIASISSLVKEIKVPIIVKEVGCGISKEVAMRLHTAGIAAINVAGAGGTSWAAIEGLRAKRLGDDRKYELSRAFWGWGIPTAASILEVRHMTPIPIIASGGIRNGMDVAKSLSIGADMAAMALPVIRAIKQGGIKGGTEMLSNVIEEFRMAEFLTGSKSVASFKAKRRVLLGPLEEWRKCLG